jgi:hypothetical protein
MGEKRSQILSVARGSAVGTLHVETVWSDDGKSGLTADYEEIALQTVGNELTAFCYAPAGEGRMDLFRVRDGASWMQKVASYPWGGGWDLVRSLRFGGSPYLLFYRRKDGMLAVHRVTDGGGLESVSEYHRTYGEVTTGFTTLGTYAHRGSVYILGYNIDDGHAAIYQTIASDEVPAGLLWQWSKAWAQGWTRVAFFRWGGENFFLKTNAKYRDVMIDHICDEAAEGTHTIGSHLPLPLDLDHVVTLDVEHAPYFATIKNSGEMTVNRLWSDGQGWDREATLTVLPMVTRAEAMVVGGATHLLLYAKGQGAAR